MAGKVVGIDGYSTNQQALLRYALKANEGDIVCEMGCGRYSSMILSEVARHKNLKYIVYYQEKNWQEEIAKYIDNAEWVHVPNWNKWKLPHNVHLILLDNEQLVIDRNKHIKDLKTKAKHVVIHDADVYPRRGINLTKEHDGVLFDHLIPNTFVISNKEEPKEEPKEEHKEEPKGFVSNVFSNTRKSKQRLSEFSNNKNKKKPPTINKFDVPNLCPVIDDPDILEREKNKTAVVCCYTPGGDFDEHYEEYIERLYYGVTENSTIPIDFHCVTIMNISISGVNRIEPLKKNWKGWHIKAEIFRKDLWKDYDRVLYIDLDTMITKNIDDILESDFRLVLLRDYYQNSIWETGMIMFTPEDFHGLYEEFCDKNPNKAVKDADIIRKFVVKSGIKPTFFQDNWKVISYKVNILRDRISHDDAQVVVFHGSPRPHEIKWDYTNKLLKTGCKKRVVKNKFKNSDLKAVKPIFEGGDCFIIGGGPSLTDVDLDRYLDRFNVLGINDGYKFKCCDACYFGDNVWYSHHKDELKEWGKPIYTTSAASGENIHQLRTVGSGLTTSKEKLGWNCNSGLAGINLALHFNPNRIFLLGYDMCFDPKNKKSNWHKNIRLVAPNTYDVFLRYQNDVKKDYDRHFSHIPIFNVEMPNYESQLEIFQKIKFTEIFACNDDEIYIGEVKQQDYVI